MTQPHGPHEYDRMFDMLRQSDPAAGVPDPDLSWVRTRVFARLGAERKQRSIAWWRNPVRFMPAAAAVCALAVGAGVVGYNAGTGSEAGNEAAAIKPQRTDTRPGWAPEAGPNPGQGLTADSSAMWLGGGRGAFYVSDWRVTPATPPSVEAFTYVPLGDEASREKIENLAGALGISGEIDRDQYGGWSLVTADGLQSLSLSTDSLGTFYFNDASIWQSCEQEAPKSSGDATAGSSSSGSGSGMQPGVVEPGEVISEPMPEPVMCNPALTATKEGALATAKRLMQSVGEDPNDFTWDVESYDTVWVNAKHAARGDTSGWSFSFYADDAPAWAAGSLATLESLGQYPVVGAEEAIRRLNDSRFGILYGYGWAYSAAEARTVMSQGIPSEGGLGGGASSGGAADAATSWEPPKARAAKPGEAIVWPIETVRIVSAELELAQHSQDGATILVPAYLMTSDAGGQYRVLAVADTALATDSGL